MPLDITNERKEKKPLFIKRRLCLLLFAMILGVIAEVKIYAKENLSHRPLVQAVSEKDIFEGMRSLGLLELQPWDDPEEMEARAEEKAVGIVQIKIGAYHGSGILFEIGANSLWILSNKHLFQYGSEGEVTFLDGQVATGTVVACSEQADLGIMEVSLATLPETTKSQLRSVNKEVAAIQNLTYGDPVFIVGSADGVAKNYSYGTVLNPREFFVEFNQFMVHAYCYAKPGISGGATFDAKGNLIGMLTGALGEESVSLPLDIMLEEYELLMYEKQSERDL